MQRSQFGFGGNTNGGFPIGGLILLGVVLLGLFFVANLIFKLLYFIAPVLLIITLIVDYKVLTNFFKWIGALFSKNMLLGLAAGLASVAFYPVTIGILFGRAMFNRKINQVRKEYEEETMQRDGQYVDFEEVPEQPMELPRLEQVTKRNTNQNNNTNNSNYEELFD